MLGFFCCVFLLLRILLLFTQISFCQNLIFVFECLFRSTKKRNNFSSCSLLFRYSFVSDDTMSDVWKFLLYLFLEAIIERERERMRRSKTKKNWKYYFRKRNLCCTYVTHFNEKWTLRCLWFHGVVLLQFRNVFVFLFSISFYFPYSSSKLINGV